MTAKTRPQNRDVPARFVDAVSMDVAQFNVRSNKIERPTAKERKPAVHAPAYAVAIGK
jgi:hypothetical protein